jgi:hypothetical protein
MICNTCHQEKGDDFGKNSKRCRLCQNAKQREYNKKVKSKDKPAFIICSKCNEKATEFRINRGECTACERKEGRKYRRENPEKGKAWIAKNRAQMAKLMREWQAKQRAENPMWATMASHRTSIRNIATGKSLTSKHVDCSHKQLNEWFRYQAPITMTEITLEDNNEWVVDHVIPIKQFLDCIQPKEIVLTWLNVSPVPKAYNKAKFMNIDKEQCIRHLEMVKSYCKLKSVAGAEDYITALSALCETP